MPINLLLLSNGNITALSWYFFNISSSSSSSALTFGFETLQETDTGQEETGGLYTALNFAAEWEMNKSLLVS